MVILMMDIGDFSINAEVQCNTYIHIYSAVHIFLHSTTLANNIFGTILKKGYPYKASKI